MHTFPVVNIEGNHLFDFEGAGTLEVRSPSANESEIEIAQTSLQ